MKIKLNEIILEFSDEQIIQYLRIKCFKIETHEVNIMSITGADNLKTNCEFAVPINEEYDPEKHKSIDETFQTVFNNSVGNFLLSL